MTDREEELTAALVGAMLQASPSADEAQVEAQVEAQGLSDYANALRVLAEQGAVELDGDDGSRWITGRVTDLGRELMERW